MFPYCCINLCNERFKKNDKYQDLRSSLEEYGIVLVKYGERNKHIFLKYRHLMQNFFLLDQKIKNKYVRADTNYQIGLTPKYKEKPIERSQYDPKERFMYLVGSLKNLNITELNNYDKIVKECVKEFQSILSKVTNILAKSYGLESEYFSSKIDEAANILATTGFDYSKKKK